MTVALPETGPLPVIVPDIERARNTPSPWRHMPRPTALPPCPSWCDHDHGDAFGPDAIPVDNTSDGGPIWGLAHHREVVEPPPGHGGCPTPQTPPWPAAHPLGPSHSRRIVV